MDSMGRPVTLFTIGNSRKTTGMFGSGYIEMLTRQITAELQSERDATAPGSTTVLSSKGISFGTISRHDDGSWDTAKVSGLAAQSLLSTGPNNPPSLIIRPFHQSSTLISLREFTNNAFNHHHGMQSEERFGIGVDADEDGIANELTRADITAVCVFQATLPPPGRVIPHDLEVRAAIANGEAKFNLVGCASCHVPSLPLTKGGWIFTEPNPYNSTGNLRVSDDIPSIKIDLTSDDLPLPRLKVRHGVVNVPAYTDFKLHDISSGPNDPGREPLDINQPINSPAFFVGNSKFITRKLWGIANQHSFGHNGCYTTMREAVLAHAGEAQTVTAQFKALPKYDQDSIIEFLKTLQILPESAHTLVVDDDGRDVATAKEHDDK